MQFEPTDYKIGELVHYLMYGKDTLGIVTAVMNREDLPPLVKVQWWVWPGHPDITQAWSWHEPGKHICRRNELL